MSQLASIRSLNRAEIRSVLQSDILRLQGFRMNQSVGRHINLGSLLSAFPHNIFPTSAVHEFMAETSEDLAATSGFVGGILSALMNENGITAWISPRISIFPPALKQFGVSPERVIFIEVRNERDALWAIEEALKCKSISGVVGELSSISFNASRRFQLSVEESHSTGFILKKGLKNQATTACVSRWKVSQLPGLTDNLPGVGCPAWKVELLRVRNGKPGIWNIGWRNGSFVPLHQESIITETQIRKAV